MSITLRPAKPSECGELTALCLRSKAWHGYDAAFMAACETELAVTPKRLARGGHAAAVDETGQVAGFTQVLGAAAECWLESLFVDPPWIGKGVGKLLFEAARREALRLGAEDLVIESDPDAVAFYTAMGAIPAGTAPSGSISGRSLPRLVLPLSA